MKRLLLFLLIFAAAANAANVPVQIKSGLSDPATCSPSSNPGERNLFWNATSFQLKYCSATNTWSAISGAGTAGSFTSVSIGTAPTACGSATACIAFTEASTAGTPTAGQSYIRADSTTHTLQASFNNSSELAIAPVEHVISWTAIANGDTKVYIPIYFACTIYAVDVTADQAAGVGGFTSDIDRHNGAIPNTTTDKISGTDGPTLTNTNQINLAHTPASWGSVALVPGDILDLNVTAFNTVTNVHVQLRCH